MKIQIIMFALLIGMLQASELTTGKQQPTSERKSSGSLFGLNLNITNNNSNSMQQASVQKQTNEPTVLLDPRLLALTDAVKHHWLKATGITIGICALGSYTLLLTYIMRNKNWIYYNTDAWHCWRNDVSIDVLKQIDPALTAQELWKTLQNKYPGKQASELLTLFINETSHEIDRLNAFIDTCNNIENWYLSYISPTIVHSRALALDKLARLHTLQHAVTSTVVAALTNPI